MRNLLVFLTLPLLGCSSESARTASTDSAAPTIALVMPDSATDSSGTTFVWHRVVVAAGARRDTLRQVMTDEEPIVTLAGDLLGISYTRDGAPDFAYRYAPSTRVFTRTALPSDVSPYFAEASFAPDGRAIAYVAEDSASQLTALIRSWPDGAELFRHEIGDGFSSDVNFNRVRWLPDGQAEFAVRVDDGGGPWVHILASRKGAASIDSLASEPLWGSRGSTP